MINEVLEVQEYLNGKNITDKNLYRICYMLAKWFKEQGKSHIEIRQSIFQWGKINNVFIKYNVNNIIYQALEDKRRLKENVIIKINNNDIFEITKRFDSKNCKLVALAILCYAKCYANRDNEFIISATALSNWLHINHGNLCGKYIPELIDFGFVTKVYSEKTYSWNKNIKSKSLCLRLEIKFSNSGDFQLRDNLIEDLYNEIFAHNI